MQALLTHGLYLPGTKVLYVESGISSTLAKGTGTGNTYYVATTGSDSNTPAQAKSLSTPWATWQHAANTVAAGDTVLFANGTWTLSTKVTIGTSGTSVNPITFQAINKWQAAFVASGSSTNEIVTVNAGHVIIKNIDVSGVNYQSGIGVRTSSGFVTISGCRIHDIFTGQTSGSSGGGGGITEKLQESGTQSTCLGNVYDSNWIFNIGNYLVSTSQLWHGIYSEGIGTSYASGSNGATIINNICYRNNGAGIHNFHGASYAVISNNLCFQNGAYGIMSSGGEGSDSVANHNVISDNLTMYNIGYGITDAGSAYNANNTYTNNQFYGNSNDDYSLWQGSGVNTLDANPLLVNYQSNGSGDYHLTSSSPGIGAGTSVNMPNHDFDGVSRPSGGPYCIGPYHHS